MRRTVYNDGIEVDQSDLRNTEDTRVSEILLTRTTLSNYGIIEGLSLTIVANTVVIGVGKLSFPNGEIALVDALIPGVIGASFEAGVSSLLGLRLTEVLSNQKPHETDPTTELTRANPQVVAEFFLATDATDTARLTALTAAIAAEVNDRNFVLIGEVLGTGTGITLRRVTQLPRTLGGDQPWNIAPRSVEQKTGLQTLYSPADLDQFPIHSARDEFHRSLIGSGTPTPNNPHGMTLSDVGGDKQLVDHVTQEHTNALIGFEPADDDFSPDSGSLAFSATGGFSPVVTVQGLVGTDVLLLRGTAFDLSTIGTTSISFTGKAAGQYYIAAKYGSDTALTIGAFDKAVVDALCALNNGKRVWPNSALELSGVSGLMEAKFFVIGLVQWDGVSSFLNLTTNGSVIVPFTGGDLTYLPSYPPSHPLFLPAGKIRLDLRRYGSITNENVQKRTIRADRIIPVVTEESLFRFHSGLAPDASPTGGGMHANASNGASGDDTTLKHVTDRDAWNLFGHRGARGVKNHALVAADPAGDVNAAGFQSSLDKWRQDNLTMTILKWSEIQGLSGTAEEAISDALATSTGGDIGCQYVFVRSGYITNVCVRLGKKIGSGAQLRVFVRVNDNNNQVAVFTNANPDGQIFVFTGVLPIVGTPGAPVRITCTRDLTSNAGNPRNLSVTAEFHVTS